MNIPLQKKNRAKCHLAAKCYNPYYRVPFVERLTVKYRKRKPPNKTYCCIKLHYEFPLFLLKADLMGSTFTENNLIYFCIPMQQTKKVDKSDKQLNYIF